MGRVAALVLDLVIDLQDPLPEPKWTWRRVLIFGVTTASLSLIAVCVDRVPPERLPGVIYALLGMIALLATYYLIAPSAEHIVSTVQAWRSRKDSA